MGVGRGRLGDVDVEGGSVGVFIAKLGILGVVWVYGKLESAKSGSSGRTIVGMVGSSSSPSGKQIVGIGGFAPSLTLMLGMGKRGELVKGLRDAVVVGELVNGLDGAVLAVLLLVGPGATAICTSSSTFSIGRCWKLTIGRPGLSLTSVGCGNLGLRSFLCLLVAALISSSRISSASFVGVRAFGETSSADWTSVGGGVGASGSLEVYHALLL